MVEPDLDSDNLYTRLGLDSSASHEDIKKAHRKLARKHHPDKGGSTEKFQNIQAAADILLDEEERKKYDDPSSQETRSTGSSRRPRSKRDEMEQARMEANRRAEETIRRGKSEYTYISLLPGTGASLLYEEVHHLSEKGLYIYSKIYFYKN